MFGQTTKVCVFKVVEQVVRGVMSCNFNYERHPSKVGIEMTECNQCSKNYKELLSLGFSSI